VVREAQLIDVVSSRIRQRRSDRRLSLDKLASLAGVSKGMLVQIESGQANPSIATLCKVAAALGASVADLVQVAGSHPAEVLPAGAPRLLWRGPKGGTATLLVGSAGPDMLELWSWALRPGERYDAPAHPQGTEELIHVVRGRLSLAFGDVSYVIDSGGSAVAHTDRPHAYACDGKKPVQFTMVVAEWHAPRREARRTRPEGFR
jgi:transcriptional regulator with XRE-family HTH domain/mannose-6-phosphate isomerase-like protein (cupin superfamily)